MNTSQLIKKSRKEHICSYCFTFMKKGSSYHKKILKTIDEDGSKIYDNMKLCNDCFDYLDEKDFYNWE